MTADAVYGGSDDDRLYALDVDDRSPRWGLRVAGDVGSTPVVLDGVVFVVDVTGRLFAVEPDA